MRHHSIDYIEFYVTDMKRAQHFYSTVLGWKFTDYGDEYAGIQKQGEEGESGGLCQVEKVTPGGPLVVIYSDDLESSFRQVTEGGGKISKEIISFPGGRRFQFTDPDGNELAVWTEET